MSVEHLLGRMVTNGGESVLEMSRRGSVMLVFLRHAGCPFCREAMEDVGRSRVEVERALGGVGSRVVFVHQGPEDAETAALFAEAGVGEVPRVSDQQREFYRGLGVKRGNLWSVFGPYVWWRLIGVMLVRRRLGRAIGDVFQMPAVMVVNDGRVTAAYRHRSQASRPDYAGIASAGGAGRKV